MPITEVQYTLPSYWASYLVNGDDSGLEDGERRQIDRWLRREGLDRADCVDVQEESAFSRSNDATDLGGDVSEYLFLLREPDAELE